MRSAQPPGGCRLVALWARSALKALHGWEALIRERKLCDFGSMPPCSPAVQTRLRTTSVVGCAIGTELDSAAEVGLRRERLDAAADAKVSKTDG